MGFVESCYRRAQKQQAEITQAESETSRVAVVEEEESCLATRRTIAACLGYGYPLQRAHS